MRVVVMLKSRQIKVELLKRMLSMFVDRVNDDILQVIFEKFDTLSDYLNGRRVSRQWFFVCFNAIVFKNGKNASSISRPCSPFASAFPSWGQETIFRLGVVALGDFQVRKLPRSKHADTIMYIATHFHLTTLDLSWASDESCTVCGKCVVAVAQRSADLSTLIVTGLGAIIRDDTLSCVATNWFRLTSLDVSLTYVTDKSIIEVAKNCPLLASLNVSRNRHVSDASIIEIANRCKQLTLLDVSLTDGAVTDEAVIEIAKNCSQLTSINAACTACKVTDDAVVALANHCPRLTSLNVSYSGGKVTDVSITDVALHCSALTFLDVSGGFLSNKVTDASIAAIARGCSQLTSLNVSETLGKVTDHSIVQVARHCPNLTYLDVSDTSFKVTSVSFIELATNCPRIRIVNEK